MNQTFIARYFAILICLLVGIVYSNAQNGKIIIVTDASDVKPLPKTLVLVGFERSCKLQKWIFVDTAKDLLTEQSSKYKVKKNDQTIEIKRKPFLIIHGNIMYDFYYQSHIDTPFIGNDLYQHTISTFLDVRIKENYPLRMYFTTRLSNNNYLRNITNLNLQYSPQTFQNTIRDKLVSYLQQKIDTSSLSNLRSLILAKTSQLMALSEWINNPSMLQKLVEEKEAQHIQKLILPGNKDSALNNIQTKTGEIVKIGEGQSSQAIRQNANSWLQGYLTKNRKSQKDSSTSKDSTLAKFSDKYKQKKQKYDSLKTEILALTQKYMSKSDSLLKEKNRLTAIVNSYQNPSQLKGLVGEKSVPDSVLPKGYEKLLAVKKFGIGTSTLNYSELSAKNITITGLQVEYSPKYYYAVAGGMINYRFRDYLLPDKSGPKQYLGLVRFGKETKNGNSLIFTYYFGRKVLYNYYTTDSIQQAAAPTPNYNLMGITLENKIKLNENTYLTAEVAKSSLPYYHSTNAAKGITGTFDVNNRSNEAYSFKIGTCIPSTNTRLEGYFNHYGSNFQSFTLVSTSSAQSAWLIKADQELLKHQLTLNASVRKNDFVSPFVDQRYVSKTTFKSIQGTLHMKKLPIISFGFYPISQLTKLNDQTYMENLFYTLTGTASYLYNQRHTGMSTTLTYMKFFNRASDSGFIYFNTTNFIVTHTVFLRLITLQTLASESINTNYRLLTGGENMQVRLQKWLSLGCGIKYNKESLIAKPLIGYSINGNIKVKELGSFQIRIDKTYIPTLNNLLMPDNIGRFTFYRNF